MISHMLTKVNDKHKHNDYVLSFRDRFAIIH